MQVSSLRSRPASRVRAVWKLPAATSDHGLSTRARPSQSAPMSAMRLQVAFARFHRHRVQHTRHAISEQRSLVYTTTANTTFKDRVKLNAGLCNVSQHQTPVTEKVVVKECNAAALRLSLLFVA